MSNDNQATTTKPKLGVYVGDPYASVLEPTPCGTRIEVVKELPNERYQVRTLAGQGRIVQTFECFDDDFYLLPS